MWLGKAYRSCFCYSAMMKAQALLFLAIVSSYIWKPGGSSQILTRGDGDSFPFPSVNPLDLGAAFLKLLRGTSGSETPTTDQNSDQNSGQSSGPGPATEPIFQLNAETSQPSAVYRTCDPGSDMFPLFATSVSYSSIPTAAPLHQLTVIPHASP